MKNRRDYIQPKKITTIFDEKYVEEEMKNVFSTVWENLPTDIAPQERILFLELIGHTIRSYALHTLYAKPSIYQN